MRKMSALLAFGMCAAGSAWGEFSGTAAFTTDYIYRGISQTDESAAVQASLDYNHESGLYAGIWGSNVDFNDGDEAQVEIDWYAGWAPTRGDYTFDVGVIYYSYPGADDDLNYDFVEGTLAIAREFQPVSLEARINYSPDFFAESGDAYYLQLNGSVPLPREFELGLHVGRQEIDDNAAFGADDYTDWIIGISRSVYGFGLSLQYVDTSLDEDECFGGTQLCDSRVVFSVSRGL